MSSARRVFCAPVRTLALLSRLFRGCFGFALFRHLIPSRNYHVTRDRQRQSSIFVWIVLPLNFAPAHLSFVGVALFDFLDERLVIGLFALADGPVRRGRISSTSPAKRHPRC
jgi:hypothetical protein